ncbi:MAG: ras guanine nucleotide exchange factor domain-containing protein [Olpidium bornovanus]|uniref:Ras guanine nucleotide exchange factor domain-containing protein n=1 Tax=Olpidium bornovanus TaxID=278681 RepID=A0A8H7ZYT5_9FUNG|nr:MAG: ras guanine nucleotide exchange factor domain-containing protein [Olpidium bornovanus]
MPAGAGPPPTPIIPKGFAAKAGWSILDIDPQELARQITLMQMRIFCAIRYYELINQEFSKKTSSVAVNVRAMSTMSTQITGWIAETILRENDIKRRCALIKHCVKIAERCMSLQNYDALMAILCALNSSTIARLKQTWGMLSNKGKSKTMTSLNMLRKATEHTKNYADYRNRLKESKPPCLPYVVLFFCCGGRVGETRHKIRPAREPLHQTFLCFQASTSPT